MNENELNIILDQRSAVPLYEQICQQIRRKIESRELEPGASLPTNHEFCERLQVSYTTAHQAMAKLAKEGYVTRQARRGTVVKGVPRRGVVGIYSWVELLDGEAEHDYYRLAMKHLRRHLEKARRVHRMYLGSELDETQNLACEDLIRHVEAGSLCGVVLTLSFPRTEELLKAAQKSNTPVLTLVGEQGVPYGVWADMSLAAARAAELLRDRGRRRVAIIYNGRSKSVKSRDQLKAVLGQAGFPQDDSFIVSAEATQQGGYEAARQIDLEKLDGLIVPDDVMASGVDRWLAERSVRVPEDLIVCTMWNRGSRMRLSRPWELFEISAQEQIRMAMELLAEAIGGRRISEPYRKLPMAHVLSRTVKEETVAV